MHWAKNLIVVPGAAIGALVFGVVAHQRIDVAQTKAQVAKTDLVLLREGINGQLDLLERELAQELVSGQTSKEEIARIQGQIETLRTLVTSSSTTTTTRSTTTTRPMTTTTSTTTTRPATTTTTKCLLAPFC